jgi:hypothetical protein
MLTGKLDAAVKLQMLFQFAVTCMDLDNWLQPIAPYPRFVSRGVVL